MSLTIEGDTIRVESRTFTARLRGLELLSIVSHDGGTEFVAPVAPHAPLAMFYRDRSLSGGEGAKTEITRLAPDAVRVRATAGDGEREMLVRLDRTTGDLCLTPSVRSTRPGLLSARWNVAFAPEAILLLPCINGMKIETTRPFPGDDRFEWPFRWNAQLAIAERDGRALMVHAEDADRRHKALTLQRRVGRTTLGLESEQLGPVDGNRAAGGVEWRVNVYPGGWKTPADRYRRWMAKTYDLAGKRRTRPAWTKEIAFAVQWVGTNPALLDRLAVLFPPKKTLLHMASWRPDGYDHNYPTYVPSDEAKAFMEKANRMGFRVMPHFNYFACDVKHPLYAEIREWQVRDVFAGQPQAWTWPPDPTIHMAYIHPGLTRWRRALEEAVFSACDTLEAPIAFLDQTLITQNTANGPVEGMSMLDGLLRLQEEMSALRPGLVLAGEGCNEISFQRQAFAQAHIHDGWGERLESRHLEAAHPLCAYLWQGHTRLVGYYHLTPGAPDFDLGVDVYKRMGAIPTLIPGNLSALTPENPAIRRLTDLAREQGRR